jgi:multiple sugar transport system ATP-binding protein
VLVGPSGCGKSTTLRMVAGLEEIGGGELYIDDELVNDVAPKNRDVAMVFQNYALYPHMTVYENMAFALKLRKHSKTEIDKKVREAAEILHITDLLERKPKALSGGQRQRVAIGRAIVRHAKVFLMDEPLSNLDAKLRNQMRTEIIRLRQNVQATFIYVTHDQTEAMTLGDRIVIMKDGDIQQVGTPQECFDLPANVFVAGFIGAPQMNLFEGQLLHDSTGYSVQLCGTPVKLPEHVEACFKNADPGIDDLVVGVRPEHIGLYDSTAVDGVEAVIDVSELMGSEIIVHASVGEEECVIKAATTDLSGDFRSGLVAGQKIRLGFSGAFLHIFDKGTEKNLLLQRDA